MRRPEPDEILRHYRRGRGLLSIRGKIPIRDESMMELVYGPALSATCQELVDNPSAAWTCTLRGNAVAIVTDGSSVLSFGDAGPAAALPVMEGKAVLCKALAALDAFPICLDERDPHKLAQLIRRLAPTFGAIAIEDIASPRSFELYEILDGMSDADLPVPFLFNDMQGTCAIVLAALKNAVRLVNKEFGGLKTVITGAGGAGISVARFLRRAGLKEITLCDRHGILTPGRAEGMNRFKEAAAQEFRAGGKAGTVREALAGADVLIGLSAARTVTPEMIRGMAPRAIVLALATPEPEIDPDEAREAGAAVVLTGGANYRHGLNVALAFPGILRGVMDSRATRVYDEMLIAAADAIASLIPEKAVAPDRIIPRVLDLRVGPAVARAVANAAVALGVAAEDVQPDEIGEHARHLIYEGEAAFLEAPTRLAERAQPRSRGEESLDLHRRYRGVIGMVSKLPLKDEMTLGIIASPGVAVPVREIIRDPMAVWDYTTRGNLVAVVSDGSAVMSLGPVGPLAALPMAEGKCALLKLFAGIEAMPLCLDAAEPSEVEAVVRALAPTLGGVLMEGIASGAGFEIERHLRQAIDIPVFHDAQHGTAVVVLAALLNAARLTGRSLEQIEAVVSGAGAGGAAAARLLLAAGVADVVVCDARGAIYEGRPGLNPEKQALAARTNKGGVRGGMLEAIRGRNLFVGLSRGGILSADMVREMAERPIVFALATPVPEIAPEAALAAGAAVVASSRADRPNMISNLLAFPGILRGALDVAARDIDDAMNLAAAQALADLVPDYDLTPGSILPRPLEFQGVPEVAQAVAAAALASGLARRPVDPRLVYERTRDYLYGGNLLAFPDESRQHATARTAPAPPARIPPQKA
ncbi:MAG TPA: malic enzyme-like NAD(P)-binding protein [Dongiaceae bacterium]|nr:malic enzyme-like NAD(P)-binding protein [Dongiaceae bacterium]